MSKSIWDKMANIFSKDGEGIYMEYKWDYNKQKCSFEFYLRRKNQKYPDEPFVIKTKTEMDSVGWARVFQEGFIHLDQNEVGNIEDTIRKKVDSAVKATGVGFSYDELIGWLSENIKEELSDEETMENYTERENHLYIKSTHLDELLKLAIEEMDCDGEISYRKIKKHLKNCGVISSQRHQIRPGVGEENKENSNNKNNNGIWHYRLYICDRRKKK